MRNYKNFTKNGYLVLMKVKSFHMYSLDAKPHSAYSMCELNLIMLNAAKAEQIMRNLKSLGLYQ
jgi:hypothetical protein